MKISILLIVFILAAMSSFAQNSDWTWWNETHGWEPGMPTWRTFLTISPGYLGPNALPVPEVKKGQLSTKKEFEVSSNLHFRLGDQTQNLSGRLYYPFADNKIAIEVYGVMLEQYEISAEVRDERAARDFDGKGIAIGDLYFSTQIQLVTGRRFPDTMLRFTGRTASGSNFEAARYSDSPGYFFDLSFSKQIHDDDAGCFFLPHGSFGFYSWQTNDDENLQNDAYMYSLGFDVNKGKWNLSNSLAGYIGYKNEKDRPLVYNFEVKHQFRQDAVRLQFTYGLRDWTYKTLTLAYIWQWD